MKKFIIFLTCLAVIFSIYVFDNYDRTVFNPSNFPGADVSVLTYYNYEDVKYASPDNFEPRSGVSKYYETSSGSLYREYFLLNNFVITFDNVYLKINISGAGLNYIIDQFNSGSIVLEIPHQYLTVYFLTNASGTSLAAGSIDGKYNAASSYITLGYYYTEGIVDGKVIANPSLPVTYSSIANKFLAEINFALIPSSDDIGYRREEYKANNFYYDDYFYLTYTNGGIYGSFKLIDFSVNSGENYILGVVNGISDLGNPPELPDVNFSNDGALVYIATYFRWILDEVSYLAKFVRIILKGLIPI